MDHGTLGMGTTRFENAVKPYWLAILNGCDGDLERCEREDMSVFEAMNEALGMALPERREEMALAMGYAPDEESVANLMGMTAAEMKEADEVMAELCASWSPDSMADEIHSLEAFSSDPY